MAKIQIKSEKITPFGGIFPIMDEFNRVLSGIALADVRVLLWRYLHRRPQQTHYTLCVPASQTPYLQFGHDTTRN